MQYRHLSATENSHHAHRPRRLPCRASAALSKPHDRSPAKNCAPSRALPSKPRPYLVDLASYSFRTGLSHYLNFRFQLDAAFCFGFRLDPIDQLEHVRGSRTAVVDDKISVHFRNARLSNV